MVRPGRPMQHVHNWQLRTHNLDEPWTHNERGWYGKYIDRWWECIRGGKIKHISPSKDYKHPVGLYGRTLKSFEDQEKKYPGISNRRVFLATSGSPYIVEDPY